jgi:hypothetical protein
MNQTREGKMQQAGMVLWDMLEEKTEVGLAGGCWAGIFGLWRRDPNLVFLVKERAL